MISSHSNPNLDLTEVPFNVARMGQAAGWPVWVYVDSTTTPWCALDYYCQDPHDKTWFRIMVSGDLEEWRLPEQTDEYFWVDFYALYPLNLDTD